MAFSTTDISLDVLVCRHGGMDNKFVIVSLSSHLDVAFHTRLMRGSQGFTASYEAVDSKFTGDTFNCFLYYFPYYHFFVINIIIIIRKVNKSRFIFFLLPWMSCSTLILPNININVLHTVFFTFSIFLKTRICLIITESFFGWLFALFSWPWYLIQPWHCNEKVSAW